MKLVFFLTFLFKFCFYFVFFLIFHFLQVIMVPTLKCTPRTLRVLVNDVCSAHWSTWALLSHSLTLSPLLRPCVEFFYACVCFTELNGPGDSLSKPLWNQLKVVTAAAAVCFE